MSAKLGEKMWHKRHDDFEPFDKITMEIVPRWKESELSGDEWRQHVQVTFWFKGHEVGSHGCRNMQAASMLLGSWLLDGGSPLSDKVLALEDDLCDQPSCTEPPVNRHILKSLFSVRGEKLDKDDNGSRPYFRKFCARHSTRGDCGREDSDGNYIVQPI